MAHTRDAANGVDAPQSFPRACGAPSGFNRIGWNRSGSRPSCCSSKGARHRRAAYQSSDQSAGHARAQNPRRQTRQRDHALCDDSTADPQHQRRPRPVTPAVSWLRNGVIATPGFLRSRQPRAKTFQDDLGFLFLVTARSAGALEKTQQARRQRPPFACRSKGGALAGKPPGSRRP